MKMKILTGVVVAGLLLAPRAAGADTLRLATLDWEPYVGQSLKNRGFSSEIVTEAFKRAGHEVKIEFTSWDKAIEGAKKGGYDAAFPEYYSKERGRDFVYSYFFSSSTLVLYARAASAIQYRTLKDLSPYSIGVVRGSITTDEFDNATYLRKVESGSDEENLRNLLTGRVDLIVIDKYAARHLIATKMPEAAGALVAMDPPLTIHRLFVVFPRRNPASARLAEEFNRAFVSMEKDGTVKAIMAESNLAE